ncbi:MAG: IclR family transcriptional regulator [Sutterella sp.]|nr:IclR family transcriptional regulator [Sutterella sp.]
MQGESVVQVFDRMRLILGRLETHGSLNLSEIAQLTSLPFSTTHRLLNALASAGIVRREGNGRWVLGYRIFELGVLVEERIAWLKPAQPILQTLADQTGHTVTLGIRTDNKLLVLSEALGDLTPLTARGRSTPLHNSAAGKLFLSRMNPSDIRAYAEREGLLEKNNEHVDELDKLFIVLAKVREYGWSIEKEDGTDHGGPSRSCVAVPVLNADKELVAAITLEAPRDITHNDIDQLRLCAAQISPLLSELD